MTSPAPHTDETLPQVVALQRKAARCLGLTFEVLDSAYGYLFEVRDGTRVFRLIGGRSPLNDAVASRLCEDKYYTELILRREGFRVPTSVRCLKPGHFQYTGTAPSEGLEYGIDFAQRRGLPLVVKPNRLSHGRNVVLARTLSDIRDAVRRIWQIDTIALIQERVDGRDYRFDYLDGRFLVGYERMPLTIRGDARRTVRKLLSAQDSRFVGERFFDNARRDPVWRREMIARGLTAESILPEGSELRFCEDMLNLNRWATAVLIRELPPKWHRFCAEVGRVMNLRHFGVDLRAADLTSAPCDATIIEVNASPLLTQLYGMGYRNEAVKAQMEVLSAVVSGPKTPGPSAYEAMARSMRSHVGDP